MAGGLVDVAGQRYGKKRLETPTIGLSVVDAIRPSGLESMR